MSRGPPTWKRLLASGTVSVLRLVLACWDVVSFPLFAIIYEPWKSQLAAKRTRAKIVDRSDNSITLKSLPFTCDLREEMLREPKPLDTLDKLFRFAENKHRDKPCLGTREVFSEEKEQQPDGKVFTKLIQGEYKWTSYREVSEQVTSVARGLREIGVEKGDKVVIYADTRAEWMVAALACFQNGITLVTLYTNLGEDGVLHGIGQTKAKTIITSQELLPKLGKIASRVPDLKTVIYFESRIREDVDPTIVATGLQVLSFSKLTATGQKSSLPLSPPGPDDLAIIMYTSGSTGTPKGALLTHGHLASAITSCVAYGCNLQGDIRSDDEAYLGYLPLAHIFELTHEITVLVIGVKVGYSGPNTLTDNSTMVKKGQKGDATVLKPTAMVAVPVILDRIYKGLRASIKAKGLFFETLFEMLYQYRLLWTKWGLDTPVLNRLVFSKFRAALGGRVRVIVGGGAPLSCEVHDFLRTCLCSLVVQGYGLTETVGGVSLSDRDDWATGGVGVPLPEVLIKLQDWQEGGYTVHDPEGPRGEIVISCPWVALGYFEMEDTNCFVEERGTRWFRTGDVGQMMPDGTLRIVDRKKDLVKLQIGEYVSLGKVESNLKVHPMVDNICVYADSTKNATVALVVPDGARLQETAMELFGSNNRTREELCSHPKVVRHVLESLTMHAAKQLERFEMPKGVVLIPEAWLPDGGLVTSALKLKRKVIQQHYQEVIDHLYATLEEDPLKVKVH